MNFPLSQLIRLQQQPAPFTPGEPLFWDDPHTDTASRKPETIDRSVRWLTQILGLMPGASLLDLGCGPGLYASRVARAGFRVTGVDYSRRSSAYASDYAREQRLDIVYRYQKYLDLEDKDLYAASSSSAISARSAHRNAPNFSTTITAELAQGGFAVQSLWGDLTGEPLTAGSEWIGVVALRK